MSTSSQFDTAFEQFLQRYAGYQATTTLDELRQRDYSRLDRSGHIYLDYTGGGLYAMSQVRAHHELLAGQVFGNPHSSNPTSLAMTELVEGARQYILHYFHASPEEYVAIFTANASHALKLVGESYPFEAGDDYLLTFDNHNSVNGIREFARAHGAVTTYVPVVLPDMHIDEEQLAADLELARPGRHKLFAYPAQSNFSGVQHSLEWIARAHEQGWDVLLDAAAFVPTNSLDLSRWHADFVPISFYKMFGYPTGVGCLLARREALAKLRRPWFAGGTITVASVQGDRHYLAEGEAAFEDGTLNYLNLPAIEIGLKHIEAVELEKIHERVCSLAGWMLDALLGLHHTNGQPLVKIYGPHTMSERGGTLTMNFYRANGAVIDHRLIEQQANEANISLRTGCFCNPGAGEAAFGLRRRDLTRARRSLLRSAAGEAPIEDYLILVGMASGGAVRVSLGLASSVEDVEAFLDFAERTYRDRYPVLTGLTARHGC